MVSASASIWIVSRDPHLITGLGDWIESESNATVSACRSVETSSCSEAPIVSCRSLIARTRSSSWAFASRSAAS